MKATSLLLFLLAAAALRAEPAAPIQPDSAPDPAKADDKSITRTPVTLTGGHETDPADHGRPVALVAAALGVKPEVFREAFTHVHPAGPGKAPTGEEARANKKALMDALGPYGITNERLDSVSNFYRYPPGSKTALWKNTPAAVNALLKDGKIIGYEITNPGAGYTTPPVLAIGGVKDSTCTIELSFTKDLSTNGSIKSITLPPPGTK